MAKQLNTTKRHPFKDNFIRSRERELYEQGVIFEPAWMADERATLYKIKYEELVDVVNQLSKLYDDMHAYLNTKYEEDWHMLDRAKEDLMQQKLAIDKLTTDDIEEGDYE